MAEKTEHEALMHYIGERQHHPEFTPKQNAILWALQQGCTRTAATGFAGISRETFYEWLKSNLTFSDAVTRAEAAAEVGMTQIVAMAAMAGDWRAAQFWLETRRRKEYGKQLDVRKIETEKLLELLEDYGSDTDTETTGTDTEGTGTAGRAPDAGDGTAASSYSDRTTEDTGQSGEHYSADPK